MEIIKHIRFKPELQLSIYKDNKAYWANSDEQGEWDENNIHFYNQIIEDFNPDDIEYDPAYLTIVQYAMEWLVEHENFIEQTQGCTRKESDMFYDIYWDESKKHELLFTWRFGSMSKALEIVEALRKEMRRVESIAIKSIEQQRAEDNALDEGTFVYRFMLDENDNIKSARVKVTYDYNIPADMVD